MSAEIIQFSGRTNAPSFEPKKAVFREEFKFVAEKIQEIISNLCLDESKLRFGLGFRLENDCPPLKHTLNLYARSATPIWNFGVFDTLNEAKTALDTVCSQGFLKNDRAGVAV